jgi:hypothetical protein
VTPRSAATAAENRPVYAVPVYAQAGMNNNTKTHKNEDAISIVFPVFGVPVVFFLCSFGVYGEEWSGAVTEIGLFLRWLRWLIRGLLRLIAFYLYICEPKESMSKRQVKHTWVFPSFWVSVSIFRH